MRLKACICNCVKSLKIGGISPMMQPLKNCAFSLCETLNKIAKCPHEAGLSVQLKTCYPASAESNPDGGANGFHMIDRVHDIRIGQSAAPGIGSARGRFIGAARNPVARHKWQSRDAWTVSRHKALVAAMPGAVATLQSIRQSGASIAACVHYSLRFNSTGFASGQIVQRLNQSGAGRALTKQTRPNALSERGIRLVWPALERIPKEIRRDQVQPAARCGLEACLQARVFDQPMRMARGSRQAVQQRIQNRRLIAKPARQK